MTFVTSVKGAGKPPSYASTWKNEIPIRCQFETSMMSDTHTWVLDRKEKDPPLPKHIQNKQKDGNT